MTFYEARLYWGFAEPTVHWRGEDGKHRGERNRRLLDDWRSTDLKGRPILVDELSTRLTKVRSYRQTLCGIEADDYVVRRIGGIEEPIVLRA